MSYLHGFLSHSWQPVLLVGMSDHKAPASKVRWSSVDNRNTMSGSGGEKKCLVDSSLISTEGNSSGFARHCVTAAGCFRGFPWHLCHVWPGTEPGMVWMIVLTWMPSASWPGRTWYSTPQQRLSTVFHRSWVTKTYSWPIAMLNANADIWKLLQVCWPCLSPHI